LQLEKVALIKLSFKVTEGHHLKSLSHDVPSVEFFLKSTSPAGILTLVFTRLRYVRVFAIANPSAVCNVHAPYAADWNCGNIFTSTQPGHPSVGRHNEY